MWIWGASCIHTSHSEFVLWVIWILCLQAKEGDSLKQNGDLFEGRAWWPGLRVAGDKGSPGDSPAGTGSLSFEDAPLRDRLLTPHRLPLYSKSNSQDRGAWLVRAWIRFPCWIKLPWPEGVIPMICKVRGRVGRRGTELTCYFTVLCWSTN